MTAKLDEPREPLARPPAMVVFLCWGSIEGNELHAST